MGITVGKYHLFKRSRKSGSFYYYWFEQGNQRIIKTCGRACTEKRVAVAYLEALLHEELTATRRKTVLQSTMAKSLTEDMFIEGAPHLARWAAKGHTLKPQTITQHRRHLANYLIPKFGKLTLDKIRPAAVEDFLLEQRLSNSCRNTILYTLKLVMREARREGIIEHIPEFEPFKRNGRRQDTLSGEELTALFPYNEQELIRIWTRPPDKRKEGDESLP